MQIAVIGATGLIGRAVCRHLAAGGHDVLALARDESRARSVLPTAVRVVRWDSRDTKTVAECLAGTDAVINLAGEPVAERRWTPEYRQRLTDSRVGVTRALVEALREAREPPRVLLNASAVGYYGDRGDELLTEESARGTGFLAELCAAWEDAALEAASTGTRVVLLRTGVVLSTEGGMFARMAPVFRAFVGGPIGSGRQWVPWIHIADEVRLILWALESGTVQGPLNLTAPAPVRMVEFARTMGEVLRRPSLLPVPPRVLRAVAGDIAEVTMASQRVLPAAAARHGFEWSFPTLREALSDLVAASA